MVRIITDSSSDITLNRAKELDIQVIPLTVTFDGTSYLDGVEISADAFYQKLASSKELPTTSQPSPEAFIPLFTEIKEKGDSAVVILLSGALSGTCQSATIARQMVGCADIHIVDSKNVTVGLQALVDQALEMRAQGLSAAGIAEKLSEMAERVVLLAMVDTLEYLYKGGRLSRTAKIAGTLLGFKPIITISDGAVKLLGRGRGAKNTIEKLLDISDDGAAIVPGSNCYFGYTGHDERCTQLIELATQRRNIQKYTVTSVGGAIGTHAGPGACVLCYLSE
ncbi:MAG: DegV family protein [Candidatus Heteroscillospira sp.]|jgi:DegV family protein with EDD domain